jgi:hypothetical protein
LGRRKGHQLHSEGTLHGHRQFIRGIGPSRAKIEDPKRHGVDTLKDEAPEQVVKRYLCGNKAKK